MLSDFSLRFKVDRATNFVYWLQLCTKWGQTYERKESAIFFTEASPFIEIEQQALREVETLLFAPENGFIWLWKRYTGLGFDKKEEKDWWKRIEEVFHKKFSFLWEREFPLLQNWQESLSAYPLNAIDNVLTRIAHFFQTEFDRKREVEIKLCIRGHHSLPSGHVKREFPNLALLNVSRVEPQYEKRVIATLVHELSHLLEYASPYVSTLLKNAFERIIVPHRWEVRSPKWKYLFSEAITTSIASHRYEESYIGGATFMVPPAATVQTPRPIPGDVQKGHYTVFIREVGQLLLPMTKRYLESAWPMDNAYAEAVAQAWVQVGKKYRFPTRSG